MTTVVLCRQGSTDRGHYVVARNRRRRAGYIFYAVGPFERPRGPSAGLRETGVVHGGPVLCRKVFCLYRGVLGAQPWRDRGADRSGAPLPEGGSGTNRARSALGPVGL